ncbi:hypothetical protein AB6A40_000265 [Gnathostoma spinigerum]|uniref:Globin domain-containing protein n=1 Tax=Gnathostoma spinigerum TaxID=75299 RepID=A0ABD6E880_9BILA
MLVVTTSVCKKGHLTKTMANTMSRDAVRDLCIKSLKNASLGEDEKSIQDGKDFYKNMFGKHPELRTYFKGAEKFTPDDVQASERFAKQGQRILLGVHLIARVYDDPATFHAYARETVNRHRIFKMDPSLWKGFFPVLLEYLRTKTQVDKETEEAWNILGEDFGNECLKHLKNLGLPH